MNDEYLRKVIEVAKEVSNDFGYHTINQKSLKAEIDMAKLAKLWQLVGYILALENDGMSKMNGYTPAPQKEEAKEPEQPDQPTQTE